MRLTTDLAQFSIATRICSLIFLTAVAVILVAGCFPASSHSVSTASSVDDVRVGVLGLFHPRLLTVSAPSGVALVIHANGEAIVLESSSGVDTANVEFTGRELLLRTGTSGVRASTLTVTGREDGPVDFVLAVPNKITRRYRGTLQIIPSAENLFAVVTMDRETAVASIVAAETTPDTPPEALKAQAIATRSILVAGRGRHRDFDFCDTTHCQFLREPPSPGSVVANAVAATRDLVLAYGSHPFAAMYTRSCSGSTRTPAELGMASATYPYFSVECKYCRTHPVSWVSRLSAPDAATLRNSNETARLGLERRLGWGTVPSNDFQMHKEVDEVVLKGTGQGHGIGLCQAGAKAMAKEGADFRQILSHYYPNTAVVPLLRLSSRM
jgi:stage II sporulation protein D